MRRLFKWKYPKLTLLLIMVVVAYFIFSNPSVKSYLAQDSERPHIFSFIAGLLFSFGFTTPIAIGLFVDLNPSNILETALLGGVGAMASDLLIFKFIKFSFLDEFRKLENEKSIKPALKMIESHISHKIKNYLLYIFAGLIIASPLPGELGVTMLAGLTKIRESVFIMISLLFNTLGILVILLLSA